MSDTKDFENKMRDALDRNGRPDPRRGSELARQAVAQFENRLRRAERRAWAAQLILMAILVFCAVRWIAFARSVEPREAATYILLTFFSIGGLIVMKLWYWVVNGKLAVLKELALLRLEISEWKRLVPAPATFALPGGPAASAEPPGAAPPDTSGASATPAESSAALRPIPWSTLIPRMRRERKLWLILIAVVGAVAAVLALSLESLGLKTPMLVTREEVTYRIAPGEIVKARSEIELTAWPKGADSATLTLPYDKAVLKDASMGGESVSAEPLGNGKYRVELLQKARYYESPTLEVNWEFPLDTLSYNSDGSYIAKLHPLIPATAYSLRVVLEAGSGFVYAPNTALHEWSAFKGSTGGAHLSFGSCGIAIRRPSGSEAAPPPAPPAPTPPQQPES